MKRSQLEHIIRAAGTIAKDNEIIILGSQAILGQFPDAPSEVLVSIEADIYPKNHPERADLIDGSIGEGSPFHETFGYYAHGIGRDTAVLPHGWQERLIPVCNDGTSNITGWCLEVHDLAISKYLAGRAKDLQFNSRLAKAALVDHKTLCERLIAVEADAKVKVIVRQRIDRDFIT